MFQLRGLEPAHIAESLDALALHFSGVDVALAVDSEIVEVVELPGEVTDAAGLADDNAVAPAHHMELAVRIVRDDHVGLLCIGPEHDGTRRAWHALRQHAELLH